MKDDLLVAYQSGFQDGRSMVERECNEVRKQRDALKQATITASIAISDRRLDDAHQALWGALDGLGET